MNNDKLLPEEDALLYIQALETHRLPVPNNEFAFLQTSPLSDLTFINTYGYIASRFALGWCEKHPSSSIKISDALRRANIILLAAREVFISSPTNKSKNFSDYALWFMRHEFAKLH